MLYFILFFYGPLWYVIGCNPMSLPVSPTQSLFSLPHFQSSNSSRSLAWFYKGFNIESIWTKKKMLICLREKSVKCVTKSFTTLKHPWWLKNKDVYFEISSLKLTLKITPAIKEGPLYRHWARLVFCDSLACCCCIVILIIWIPINYTPTQKWLIQRLTWVSLRFTLSKLKWLYFMSG